MFTLKKKHIICRKVHLTLNFKILPACNIFFISISELLYQHKIICMTAAQPVSLNDVRIFNDKAFFFPTA